MDFAGRSVADDVGEGFLGNPIEDERDVLGELRELRELTFSLGQAEAHRQAVPPLDLPAGVTEGFGQAPAFQNGGMKLMAQAAEVFTQPGQVRDQGIQPGAPRVVVRELPAHGRELETEGSEALAVVVMELAGDPAPRLFLSGDKPTHGRRGIARHITAPPGGAVRSASSTRLSVPSLS